MAGLELRYFIMKPKGTSCHAAASRAAMLAYVEACTNPELAKDIKEWVAKEKRSAEFGKCDCGYCG